MQPAQQYSFTNIEIDKIDVDDTTFRITAPDDLDNLCQSINHVGLLTPPFIQQKKHGYRILTGFRRIAACRALQVHRIQVLELNKGITLLECVKLVIADNAMTRPVNLMEKANAYRLLSHHTNEDQELSDAATAAGLPNPVKLIHQIEGLTLLPENIQNAIRTEAISLTIALELGKLPHEIAALFGSYFQTFKLGLNRQREMINQVVEISRRDHISMMEVLQHPDLQSIWGNMDLDKGEKAKQLRSRLRRMRFPALTEKETAIQKVIKDFALPHRLKLSPPPFFESDDYTLLMSFSSISELNTHQKKIKELISTRQLDSLFT
ncbi:MAG: ParB/RepB/Spo0J family partition protein [Desulfobacteraceae bacterium]|nr:ParB/RepB/Spo0J family partition protein [Desulfobacteraceae bacterium]